MSKWWETEMSDAGQGMYQDPALALQVATLPPQVVDNKDVEATKKWAQDNNGGLLKSLGNALGEVDGALSNIPGYDATKSAVGTVGSTLWYPVDKLATGARWLYSEGFSQPLSTLFLQTGKAQSQGSWFDMDSFTSDWGESYDKAENISPAQAFMNAENVMSARGEKGLLADMLGADADGLTKQERDQVKRQSERFIYDTDYWREKQGWKYTVGTGAMDFFFIVAADPLAPVVAGAVGAIKAGRSVQMVDDGSGLVRTKGVVGDIFGKAPQTVDEVANGKKMNEFFDWSMKKSATGAERKTAAEIAAHPIWGRGRRVNPFASQYGQVLAKTERTDMPLMLRFSMGDNAAARELSARGGNTLSTLGKLSENRVMLSSTRLDDEMMSYFAQKEAVYPGAAAVPDTGRLFEPPTPRPGPEATAAQRAGWDARWGRLAEEGETHRQAASAISGGLMGGVRPLGPSGGINQTDMLNANSWKTSQLQIMDNEIGALQAQAGYYQTVLGANLGKSVEDFAPGEANLFGTMKQAYRMGGLGLRSVEKAADKKIAKIAADRKGVTTPGNFVTATIRKGFYGTSTRVVQSIGDRVPQGRINHNEADAGDRLMDMLKQVPALGTEQRLSMMDSYLTAGDKVAKSKVLNDIQMNVLNHMATRVHGLDNEVASIIGEMTQVGIAKTMAKLTNSAPKNQMMSSAERLAPDGTPISGKAGKVDYAQDGEAWVLAPLAKTQLSMTDTLLPVKEINRVLSRNSGAIKSVRRAGGKASDSVVPFIDSFNVLWKASTLLRPAYVPRMISEELMASAVKFGAMSRLIADPAKGGLNFVRNRAQYVSALAGKGSYIPSTGAGVGSSFARVQIVDEDIAQKALARRGELKTQIAATTDSKLKASLQEELSATGVSRIKVSKAMPIVRNRIDSEMESVADLQKEIARTQAKISRLGDDVNDSIKVSKRAAYASQVTRMQDELLDHQAVVDEHVEYANEILRVAKDATGRRLGEGTFEAFGQKVPQVFSKEWEWSIPRDQISSDNAYSSIYARGEAVDIGRAVKTGSWDEVTPDMPNHMEAWVSALNLQFRQDDVFRLVAGDATGKSAAAWLKTPAGREHLADMGVRGRDPQGLIEDVAHTLDKYLPEGTGLRPKMAAGDEITPADLKGAITKEDFPAVHGEEVKYNTGIFHKETPAALVDKIIEKGFRRLGSIPSDVMSRHPVYIRAQEARFRELMGQELSYKASVGRTGALDPAELEKIRNKSDTLARKDISQVVYDPKRTTASEALRFIYPFFTAHADSLARWGGLVAERPQMLTTVAKIYNAPVAANLVTDDSGNAVDLDGYANVLDPTTGKVVDRKFVPMAERVINFRMPWEKATKGSVPIKISAMNTILPGDPWFNPGAGPLVQVAGSEIAKSSPQVGDFLQWAKILPYGPAGSVMDAVTPKYMRKMYEAWQGADPENESYQRAYLAVYNKKVAEYHEGGPKVNLNDVKKEAQAFLNLEILRAWGSPAQTQQTPLTGTPYQFFVDQYDQLMKADPQNAKDMFLAKYGSDYFGFTASLTKSMGIASSISADTMAEKYKDLIELDPEMAPFIIGNVYNGGPFSASVYKKQLEQSFGGEKVREKLTAQQAIEKNQVDQGWAEYTVGKNYIDAALIRSGFTSYSQKGAEQINESRANLIAGISQNYPGWGEAFAVTDRGKVPNRISAFERLALDERLLSDPFRQEMQPLVQYLQARQYFKQVLAERGAKKLSFDVAGNPIGENADLGHSWSQFTMGLINSNIAFGQLYNRYLSSDDLQ